MTSLRNYVITIIGVVLVSCQAPQSLPRVATSFWQIVTPAYSDHPGYAILYEGKKERHCIPITSYFGGYGEDDYHILHHHGVAVESELMAYRIYCDKKQTIDVYCKRTPRLELAESYWYPNDSLLAEHYGDDIIRVGGSIGVGSVNYWRDGKLRHFEEVGERQQWIVEQNDTMAVIQVSDIDWTVPDGRDHDPETRQIVNFSAQYTLRAGHRDMRCDVTLSEPLTAHRSPFTDTPMGLCTGVQSIPNKGQQPTANSQWHSEQLPKGTLLASWGTDWPVNDSAKFAKETVGLAVFIPTPYAGELVHNKSNNLCLLNFQQPMANSQQPEMRHAHFYLTVVGVTKEDHPVATTFDDWLTYLHEWAKELE